MFGQHFGIAHHAQRAKQNAQAAADLGVQVPVNARGCSLQRAAQSPQGDAGQMGGIGRRVVLGQARKLAPKASDMAAQHHLHRNILRQARAQAKCDFGLGAFRHGQA
jgi:hypothetical protein